uniref:Uncharacterized protein n=1 Tax=Arcella intermedia TaxID=1963864 RepID=A0A6B2LUJ0_9EUKA
MIASSYFCKLLRGFPLLFQANKSFGSILMASS